jgi:hypothetical protein
VADIPYTIPAVHRLLGAPEVRATVVSWEPPRQIGATFLGRRIQGDVMVRLTETEPEGCCRVEVDGSVRANARRGGAESSRRLQSARQGCLVGVV